MKRRSSRVVSLLLTLLFTLPTPQLLAMAQEAGTNAGQDQRPAQSEEEKKIRKAEENRIKKEEERKRKEAKARASEMKKYTSLTEFALDLYASDIAFKD